MRCSNCGSEFGDGMGSCPTCGTGRSYAEPLRDPSVTALRSFLVIGSGQMALGETRRGIAFLTSAVLATLLLVALSVTFSAGLWHTVAVVSSAGLLFGIWVANILDAYNQTRLYNGHLRDVRDLDK